MKEIDYYYLHHIHTSFLNLVPGRYKQVQVQTMTMNDNNHPDELTSLHQIHRQNQNQQQNQNNIMTSSSTAEASNSTIRRRTRLGLVLEFACVFLLGLISASLYSNRGNRDSSVKNVANEL